MDGSAEAGSDYVARSLSNQSIAEGQTSYSFDVQIIGDLVNEPTESYTVELSAVSGNNGGSIDSRSQARLRVSWMLRSSSSPWPMKWRSKATTLCWTS